MPRIKKDTYQENLDAIKESGSIAKQSTDPIKKVKMKRVSSDVQSIPSSYNIPQFQGSQLGDSDYDGALNLPISFYDGAIDAQESIFQSELNEARAQEQPGGVKLLAGLGRVVAKTGTEFGKGIGYLGGGIASAFTGEVDTIVNNAFVNAFESLDEKAKEAMPVYVRREIQNGTLGRQVWSPEFWATDVADAAGFLASSILLGGGLGAVAKAGISRQIANLAPFIGAAKGAKTASAIDMFVTTMGQSYVESFAETDGAIKEFDEDWAQYQQEDGTYLRDTDGDGEEEVISPDQVKALRGDLGANTFAMNMVATALPNYFTTKAIFGTAGRSRNIFDELDIDTKSIKSMKEGLANANTRGKIIAAISTEGAKGAASEGFQEWSQFAIQEYEGAKSKMMTDDGLVDGLIEGYKKALNTVDGQKSIFLGAFLGLGPGLVKGFRERKSRIERATGLTKLMEENNIDLRNTFENYYKKDENGEFVKDKDGENVLNIDKLIEDIEQGEKDMNDEALLAYTKAEGLTHAAKTIATKKIIEKALPYFQIAGGEEIFSKHFEELSEVIESDGKLMGFSSKEDYMKYLKETVTEAKKEYDNIKNVGPRYFGININDYANKVTKPEAKQALEQFYNQMEAQGALYGALLNLNKKELTDIKKKIGELEGQAINAYQENAKEPKDDVSMDTKLGYLPDSARQKKEWEILQNQKNVIEKNLSDINSRYKSLFNKREQQEAFNNQIQKVIDKQEAQQEYEQAKTKDKEFAAQFYQNLKDKGYGEDLKEVFNSNQVRLKDSKGRIYAILKMLDDTGKKDFFIMPTNDVGAAVKSQAKPLTVAKLEELGLDKPENIMTPNEFQEWKKQQKIIVFNNLRLERLSSLISSYENKRNRTQETINEKIAKLEDTRAKIEFWKNQTEIPLNEIIDELNKIEEAYEQLEEEVQTLREYGELMIDNIELLNALRREIHLAINENREFSFSIKLQQLKERFEKNDFETDEKLLVESIEAIENQIENLETAKTALQDAIDDLYSFIVENDAFKNVIENINKGKKEDLRPILQFMKQYYPEVSDTTLEMEDVKTIMYDDTLRRDFLKTIKNKQKVLVDLYSDNVTNLRDVAKSIKKAKDEYANAKWNADVLKEYNILEKNINYLKTRNKLAQLANEREGYSEKGTGQTSAANLRVEQDGDSSRESPSGPLKTNEYSTIVGIYEDTVNEVPHSNPKKFQQASDWAKAMMKISLDELESYSLRIVDNKQLAEIGVVPPSDDSDDLYGILHKDGAPYIGDSGQPIFTGIAHTSTYFPDDGPPTIAIERSPDYQEIVRANSKQEITPENPYTINNIAYNSLADAIDGYIQKRRLEYQNWRDGLSTRAGSGEQLYFPVKHVSKGHVPKIKYGNEKRNPKSVFDIKGLIIADKNVRVNEREVFLEDGKVYAQLENGQYQRLLNKSIGMLPVDEKVKTLNRIIHFMALAQHLGKEYNKGFPIRGTKGNRMSLFGNAMKPGIMDTLIAWNTKNEKWNIKYLTKKSTGEKAFVFHIGGQEKWLPVKDLYDAKGNIRKAGDPVLTELVAYLEHKHLNVVKGHLNKGILIPLNWRVNNAGVVEISKYEAHKSYNDYVLNNHLYTEVNPETESDKLPMMVNQYIEIGKDDPTSVPPRKEEKKEEKPSKEKYTITDKTEPLPTPKSDVEAGKEILKQASEQIQEEVMSPEAGHKALLAALNQAVPKEETKENKEEDCPPESPHKKKRRL